MRTLVTIALLVGIGTAAAQDTVRVYRFPEVVVSATRSMIDVLDSPSPVDILEADAASVLASSAADLIGRSGSVFLRDLGGMGALKTVYFRGTAPQHLLVLVNGVRQNSHQNGLVDFGLLSLTDVQRIEVVRGGSSALYGADALGGVVNILTRTPGTGLRLRANVAAGSYGYRSWKVEGEGRPGGVGLLAGVASEEGRDEFPFRLINGSSEKRTNADFRKRNAFLHGDIEAGHATELQVDARAVRAERGVPGSLVFPSPSARQADDDVNLGLEVRNMSLEKTQLTLRTSYHYSFQTYRDPESFFPANDAYRNGYFLVNPEVSSVLGEHTRVLGGVEWNEGTLAGSNFEGVIRRVQRSVYVSGETRLVSDRSFADLITLYGMLRYDDISDVGNALMPKVGVNVRLLREGEVRFRASYGQSFRTPSFNDLHFVGFNNPDLKPEYSTSMDAGLVSSVRTGDAVHTAGLTWYSITSRDRILFDLVASKPVNIGRTTSRGIEAVYTITLWNGGVEAEVNYAVTNAVKRNESYPGDPGLGKQLPFIPKHSANVVINGRWDVWHVRVSHGTVGRRFTVDDNSMYLPEFHVTDVMLSAGVETGPVTLRIAGEVRNILDRSYEVFAGYPMPGRSFRLGAGVEY